MQEAELVHQCPDRLRLRFPGKRGDAAFFEALRKACAGIDGVLDVKVRARTGSLIVRHDCLESMLDRLKHALSFETQSGAAQLGMVDTLVLKLAEWDRQIRTATNQQLDIRSAFFLLFLFVSVIQAARGKLAPTALAAAWMAYTIAQQSAGTAQGGEEDLER